ncbi:MAG: EAL domain-containing protein [Alphaproteobacteria bacterium]|nr:EAL domain-containing protein [Alphaproteobacteria bacterium]
MANAFSVLTDREGRISTSSEDAENIVGRSDGEIQAMPLFELFENGDKDTVAAALKSASRTAQTVLSGLHLQIGVDTARRFDISIDPAGPDRFWVHFAPSAGEEVSDGPVAKEAFLASIANRLGLPDSLAMRMLMFDFDGLENGELNARLGDEAVAGVRSSIEEALTEAAVDGQIGRLGASSYGVLGAEDQGKDDIVASVVVATSRFGVTEDELGVHAESVALDAEDSDPGTLRGLLSHACHKFYQAVRNGAAFGADRLSEISVEIEQAVLLVETALERGDVSVTTRRVHRLSSGDVSLCLAQGALVFGDERVAVDRLLVLDDHPDLCSRHDRAIVVAAVASLVEETSKVPVIVDIGLPTLESGDAARMAAELAAEGHMIGFRPQGFDMASGCTSAVRQVYSLLKEGTPVWLANFSAAIAKTRRLQGAYVEISATFLRDISKQPDRNTLMSRLLKVWNDVEVRLVAVNVDSKNLATFANKLGIAYGIGIAADPSADAPQSTKDIVT